MRIAKWLVLAATLGPLAACSSSSGNTSSAEDASAKELTVGTVQKEIHVGMSGAEVAAVLGSPNIVTTDEERREVWVYDRISTTSAYTTNSAYGTILILGASSAQGEATTTQKTLTVVVKFGADGRVRDFAYHASKF